LKQNASEMGETCFVALPPDPTEEEKEKEVLRLKRARASVAVNPIMKDGSYYM